MNYQRVESYNFKKSLGALVLLFAMTGCASVARFDTASAGHKPICGPGVELGETQVLLKTDWRPDQKAPEQRAAMALDVVNAVFEELPCGRLVQDSPLNGVETIVEITVREFGPQLILSVPVLWSTYTDVDASIRVIDARSGELLFSAQERRQKGGAFALKSLSAVPETFEAMLVDWLAVRGQ